MASTPHNKHVYNVPNFDLIQEVQKKIITEVCSGVDDQLSSLVSGEESKSDVMRMSAHILKVIVASNWFCSPHKHFLFPTLSLLSGGATLQPAGHRNGIKVNEGHMGCLLGGHHRL